jgi:hypothetical protein
MGKKKSHKRQQFKYSSQKAVSDATENNVTGMDKTNSQKSQYSMANRASQAMAGVEDFGYVRRDLRGLLTLAVACVALELVIWYVFGHTPLGTRAYSLFSI